MSVDKVIAILEDWERLPLALVTMAGPWFTPLVPAWFVGVAIHKHLSAPVWVAVIAGIVLEVVGIAGIASSTRAFMWNNSKRKSDKQAPLALNIAATSIYFATALLLTVVLEVWPSLAKFAPGMFIIVSVSSGSILVLASIQRGLERGVKVEKEERREAKRQSGGNLPEAKPIAGNLPEALPDWLGVRPETCEQLTYNVREGITNLEGITSSELARYLPVGERMTRNWIRAAKNGSTPTI